MEKIGNYKICIIGAGFSGICAGIKLQTELDIHDFIIFDENHDVGGTWLTHVYPGCACDVASHVYSYSFELNPNWSTSYARQPEILAYLKGVALKYDLYSKAKFQHQVKLTSWDENSKKWKVSVLDKALGQTVEYEFDIMIAGNGGLRVPNIPEQFSPFKGPVMHSAKWDYNISLDDKVVGVIGSGCSAVQIVPSIQPKVRRLISFQRHPAWIVPQSLFEFPSGLIWLFNKLPALMWLYRLFLFFSQEMKFVGFKAKSWVRQLATMMAHMFIRWQIPDNPDLRRKLLPNYELGCKRISPSNAYYKALAKSGCEVVKEKISHVTSNSIVTEDGKEHQIDVLILCTGYRIQEFFAPMKTYGVGSQDVLQSWLQDGPSHYLGIVSASCPNSFFLLGPNTAYGHNSVVFSIECQVNWITQVLKEFIQRRARIVAVKKSVEREYMVNLRERFKDTVWGTHECGSWYVNHKGENTTLYPNSLVTYWKETRQPNFSNLDFY